eukprot:15483705-Alexandrium_andersonii.AAC.1
MWADGCPAVPGLRTTPTLISPADAGGRERAIEHVVGQPEAPDDELAPCACDRREGGGSSVLASRAQ